MKRAVQRSGQLVATAGIALMVASSHASAQVTRIEIISRESFNSGQPVGGAGPYEVLRGLVHGEVDPRDPHNTIIQDLQLAPRNARGKVEYAATFALATPVDVRQASGVLIYQVVNRGNGTVAPSPDGHFSLVSGWQGDLAPTATNQTIEVPIARNADGSAVTGPVLARFYNVAAGTTTMPIRLSSMTGSRPVYPPASLDEPTASLSESTSESATGVKTATRTVPRAAWAFADCRTKPFPGTPDPERVCLRDGFDPVKLYELVYSAKDPLVLGIGLAATRDINAFFRHALRDEAGTPNPIAGLVHHAISVGDSQSGNFIKTFIHLGFNQDLTNRIVWDGVFPRIAARQTPIDFRFALPGGAATVYEPGSEPVVWWETYEDTTRRRPAASLLDRCRATNTCPRIIEAFGSSEFWGLRMSPGLIGTDARRDIPLPSNVRRYYYPGTTHNGGRGGFAIAAETAVQPGCSLPANPNPESDTTRALTEALIAWVVNDRQPPPSRYPRLDADELIPAATAARRFPTVPQFPLQAAAVNPVIEYDFGPTFIANDMTGVIARQPPKIVRIIPTYVPDVNADGNETTGVPSVLHQVPLGTYLGWNITASGFFKGQACGFSGGYVPFAKTREDRLRTRDPRLSVEERYGTLEGYVCGVERAVAKAIDERFLLRDDAARLLDQAKHSRVLPTYGESSWPAQAIAQQVCGRALP